MTDLNNLVPTDSPLYLLVVSGINAEGAIAGFGVTPTGDLHAFLATPMEGQSASVVPALQSASRPALLDHARELLRQRLEKMGGRVSGKP